MVVDTEWRKNALKIRNAKKEWVKNNIDLKKYDPYVPAQVEDLTKLMIESGVLHKSNNMNMMLSSTEKILIQLRKEKGVR